MFHTFMASCRLSLDLPQGPLDALRQLQGSPPKALHGELQQSWTEAPKALTEAELVETWKTWGNTWEKQQVSLQGAAGIWVLNEVGVRDLLWFVDFFLLDFATKKTII